MSILRTALFFIQLALLLERNTTKYSAVIQLLMDKSIITADYDDICEHVGDSNEFWCWRNVRDSLLGRAFVYFTVRRRQSCWAGLSCRFARATTRRSQKTWFSQIPTGPLYARMQMRTWSESSTFDTTQQFIK